jgi:AcrR family transcriptional regulator
MPRKRAIPDHDVLDAALSIVRAQGPGALTFAALADRVELAPATIVQRFGTKAGLLRAALTRAWDLLDEATSVAIDQAPLSPAGVIEILVALSGQYSEGDDFADQLLILREDLRDPVLRERGRLWLERLSEAIEGRLDDTLQGRTERLGLLVFAEWQGALIIWSFRRKGSLRDEVRMRLEELLHLLDIRS